MRNAPHRKYQVSTMEDISAAVHNTIKTYRLSGSGSYHRLDPKNEKRITKKLIETKQHKKLLEIIHKRDHYNKRLYELLDKAGQQNNPAEIFDLLEGFSYIKRHLMTDPSAVEKITALIDKQTRFQKDLAKRQALIKAKYEESALNSTGLAKLKLLDQSDRQKKSKEMNRELNELYMSMASEQTKQSEEAEATLRQLKVPFFVLSRESCQFLQLELDRFKRKMLDRLQHSILLA